MCADAVQCNPPQQLTQPPKTRLNQAADLAKVIVADALDEELECQASRVPFLGLGLLGRRHTDTVEHLPKTERQARTREQICHGES